MTRLDCGHDERADSAGKQVCPHLLQSDDPDFLRLFTGEGSYYRLVCATCSDICAGDIVWLSACEACLSRIESDGLWMGIRGTPAIREEPSSLAFVHRRIPVGLLDGIGLLRRVEPVTGDRDGGSRWVALTAAGSLVELDLNAVTVRLIANVPSSELDTTAFVSLTCSPDGDYLCLMQTLGEKGVVIETSTGRRTMRLRRGDYCSDVSPFPAAFFRRDGRTLLAHATDWNRLDVSDPATGDCVTERSLPTHELGQERQPHDLDYFHGRLYISPGEDRIADDGWVWHPVGEVRVWSLRRWLEENPWESEDGPTAKGLARRAYFWGGPMCWMDEKTLAVWGYGEDDEWLLPAVRLFDVESGTEKCWFPGPEVAGPEERKGHAHLADFGGSLYYDRYLFAISKRYGTSVWDIRRGARLHQDPSFAPVAFHPQTKEFLTILPGGSLQLSRLGEVPS